MLTLAILDRFVFMNHGYKQQKTVFVSMMARALCTEQTAT
jgi:hypothetical protein